MENTLFKIICFTFFSSTLCSQIAVYNFESNLLEEIANHNAKYIENGVVSDNTPSYITSESDTHITLDKTEGLMFPSSLNAGFDVGSSIEFSFNFRMEDIGDNEGFLYLISNQNGLNGTGWSIFASHDIFSDVPNYELVFSYADGGFDRGVPNHPGHNKILIGNFLQEEWVNIKLIMNFENNSWSAIANGNYTSAFFNNEFDLDLIKESITDNDLFLGWTINQEQDLEFNSTVFANEASYDQLEIYSPKQPGDPSILSTAIQAMTNHVNGSSPLSEAGLTDNLVAIQLNYDGNYESSKAHIFEYINAYEERNAPLFLDRSIVNFSTLSVEAQLMIFFQQDIFDNQFVSGNLSDLDGIKFEAADVFPGPVAEAAPRLNEQVVQINGSYSSIQGARLAADLNDAKRPTGYYLAPGDLATIEIPAALINNGLKVMVGAHDSDHSVVGVSNRFVRISKLYALDSEVTTIANPFGGGIYIKVPEGSDIGWFDIKINGAVKSPYFSGRSERLTNPSDWQAKLADNHVPWVDIEGDKFMTTLPLDHVADLDDPTLLLSHWSNIMDGYRYMGGRPYPRARAEYFLVDSRLPSSAYGTGYPQVVSVGEVNLYPTNVLNEEFYKTFFHVTLHEYGHLAAHPTLPRETESIIHINASYIYNEYYGLSIDDAFKYSASEQFSIDEASMDWMLSANFRNDIEMSCDPDLEDFVCDEVRYQHRGHAKFIDMARIFGWESIFETHKVFYDRWTAEFDNTKVVVADEIIEFASNGMGVNMAPLMHFWGLHPSDALAEKLSTMPKSEDIRQSLLYYKSIIPDNREAFLPWYEVLRAKKDAVHNPRFDLYLETYDSGDIAAEMRAQIDYLIATYFALNTEADIVSFSLTEQIGETEIDVANNKIEVTVENGTNLTDLKPSFTLSSGATAQVEEEVQESTVSVVDFTEPVIYKITAEDNENVQEWTVTITEDMSSIVIDQENLPFLFYPNPVKDKLYLDLTQIESQDASLEIYDLVGRKIESITSVKTGSVIVDVNAYRPGIYFGIIRIDNKDNVFKFVKQ